MSTHSMNPTNHSAHDDNHIHMPDPSWWPILLAFSAFILPIGLLMSFSGGKSASMILVLGGILSVVCMMGWANQLIKENETLPDVMEDDRWMRLGLKLFLISEASIFGAFFAHNYYMRSHAAVWPPDGAPELETHLPAIATLILMASSGTMEWAHSSLMRGKKKAAGWWTLLTIAMGIVFLGFQGYEWGFLKTYDEFTQQSGIYGTLFYIMTGFHGAHVATGLLMLTIVWVRIKLGHYDEKRHFSFAAASWYWHFVDVIWVFLFFTIYLI